MSQEKKDLSHFELRLVMGKSLDCFAGNTPDEASSGRYRTKNDAPRSLFEELLAKLIKAIHDQAVSIPVSVLDDKWIVEYPDSPMADVALHISAVLEAENNENE